MKSNKIVTNGVKKWNVQNELGIEAENRLSLV